MCEKVLKSTCHWTFYLIFQKHKIFQRRIHNQIQAYFECKLSESVDFARAQVHSFGGCDWEMEENGR